MTELPLVLQAVEAAGHSVFTRGKYNLNIVAIRTPHDHSNTFNDRICLVYKDDDGWVTRTWEGTCDPGKYYRQNPMNARGCAQLVPGQYRGSHRIGRHKGYDALVQTGSKVAVWRDNDRDATLDNGPGVPIERGFFGINIHRSSATSSERVDRWSGGCVVFKTADPDFSAFMALCRKSAELYGNRFTLTLIEDST
jgi:hypothetical protein|tara:strand:+ start:7488 stop:8072 length:585 start_codon:yes stop_codon:yes gene_type:complete